MSFAATGSAPLDGSATVGRFAERGEAAQVGPERPVPLPRRVVLVTDSVLAAIGWANQSAALTNGGWDLHLASCRRLVLASCGARPPKTVERELREHHLVHGPASPTDIVVISVGYNDFEERFVDDFRVVVGAARAAGFGTIVWVNYRDVTSPRRAVMNRLLRAELATGAYPDVHVWDYRSFTASRPEWFVRDGVHLTATGAHHVTRWLNSHLSADSPPWSNG